MTGLRRPMRAVTTDGLLSLGRLNDGEASVVARHDNAVRKYLYTGDSSDLDEFTGVVIAGHLLETRLDELDLLGHVGEINFWDIYGEEN